MALSPHNRALFKRVIGLPVDRYTPNQVANQLLDRLLDAARAEGEEAGTIKAEQNAGDCIARLKAAHLAPFEEAGAVFWAVAEVECDYHFTTTTEMKGDSYVITMVAKPRPRHVRVTVVHP